MTRNIDRTIITIFIRIGIGGDRLDLPEELQTLDNYSATLAHKVDSQDGDDDDDDDDDNDDNADADDAW